MPDALSSEFVTLQQAVVGRYSLERELGRGGMGIVFLARDVALDRLVAIKLLPPVQAAQADLKDRFLREARTSAKLSHPNIVPIYLVEEKDRLVFFVMAYVEGETLGHRLRTKGPLSPSAGTKLLQEVGWALAYAHLRGIVHRDVKPDNIMMEQLSGRALVSDFGIARATSAGGGTGVGEILGTPQYMSPEQAAGEAVDGRSDIYSLGIVGFYALSGRLPFDAPDVSAILAMQITRPAVPLSQVAPGVPGKVAQAVDKCLAKQPDERWPTGEAFADALAQATVVVREIPAPIRVWLAKGESIRPQLYFATALFGGTGVVYFVIASIFGLRELMTWSVREMIAITVPWIGFTLYRLYQTQRVIAAGYTLEDITSAFRRFVERRKEELTFEYDFEPPIWAKVIRWLAFTGVGVAGASVLGVVLYPAAALTLWAQGLVGGSLTALVGSVISRLFPGKRLEGRDKSLEYRIKFYESRFGRLLFRLAGLGVKPTALPAGATQRPTELAIGMAADQIFESLARETKKALKDLPLLVRRLEAEAGGMRARVDELNAMIADVGDQARVTQAEDQRAKLRSELEAKRDQASQRLATTVAALENIRLDLLRLKAGVGTVDQLTADLAAARDVHQEIEFAVEARREVEAALRAKPAPAD